MNDTSPIQTQPEPDHLASAGNLLEAVLLGDLDLDTRISIGITVGQLFDVYPPYEPRARGTEAVDLRTGIPLAIAALASAAEAAESVPEIVRFGIAARELRELQDRQ